MMQEINEIHGLQRPSVSTLLGHILSYTISNATVSLFILGSAMIGFLRYYDIPSGDYFMLLLIAIAFLAFLQGCKAWQADLDQYQKSLADARHTHSPRP
jgi:hypothetical protein